MLRPEPHAGKDPEPPGRLPRSQTPLPAVLWLTWLTSFGTAVAWAGIFFVTEQLFSYSKSQNLALAASLGLVYALSAYFATPITGVIVRPRRSMAPRRSARGVLALLLGASGLVALIPILWTGEWTIWLFGFLYTPLTGLIWPTIETYVSSGRRGRGLNRATGWFNLAWASAMIVSMWAMAPVIEHHALWIIGGLVPLHLGSLLLLPLFNPEPRPHGEPAHEHDADQDAAYRKLLRFARVALFSSYVLHASLMPIIPQIMAGLSIPAAARPALASIWMTARLGAFAGMQRWSAWHGRRTIVVVGIVLMVIAYVGAVTAPSALVLGVALGALGVGVGAVYAAAIYYALEVGATDLDAGGKHEAMIGFGYTVGPAIALVIHNVFSLAP